jgi:hypothetical protein
MSVERVISYLQIMVLVRGFLSNVQTALRYIQNEQKHLLMSGVDTYLYV